MMMMDISNNTAMARKVTLSGSAAWTLFNDGMKLSVLDIDLVLHGGDLLLQDQVLERRLLLHLQDRLAELGLDLVSLT